jgi:transposase IS116/IS110/IS902 family protein
MNTPEYQVKKLCRQHKELTDEIVEHINRLILHMLAKSNVYPNRNREHFNPIMRTDFEKKIAEKPYKVVMCAIMRKMVLSSILTVAAGMQAGLILVLPIQLVLILLKP